jgi:murein DD-endopeptidase MepM/ murein hydrolase activator NlpD
MGGSVQLPTPGSVRLPRGWVSSVADPGQLGCRIAIPDEHPRLDIANDAGTPVYAPFSGIVSRVYDDDPKKGYGIEITNEDGLSARLIHLLNRPLWNKGDEINIGQQTGFMGNTGFSFGNHLDFMLFTGPSETARDNAVDPSLFLGAVNSGDRVSW